MYSKGHSFFTYISNNPNALASCCFTGDEKIYIIENDHDLILSDFKTAYSTYGNSIVKTYQTNPYTTEAKIINAKIVKTTTKEWITIRCNINASLQTDKMSEEYKCNLVHIKVTPDHILPVLLNGKIVDLKVKDLTGDEELLFDARCLHIEPICKKDRIFSGHIYDISRKVLESEEDCYCFEVTEEFSPYFNLFSGLITHNCRLRNEIAENVFSFTNGLTGVQTGSANVITLNLNRIIQDWSNQMKELNKGDWTQEKAKESWADLHKYLVNILERVYKYHIAYKTLLYGVEDAGMLNASTAGYINMHKLFSTIGINGLNEAAEFLGIKCNYNEEYKEFCRLITGTISEQNKLHSKKDFQFNTELVPKCGGHVKPLLIDSKLPMGQRGASREIVQRDRLSVRARKGCNSRNTIVI